MVEVDPDTGVPAHHEPRAPVTIRPISEDELGVFAAVLQAAFNISNSHAVALANRVNGVAPLDRTRAAFVGGDLVGTLGSYPFTLTVPGGSLPMAGTAVVSVHPAFQGQGLMTQLMRSHLNDARTSGNPLAGLWASEGSIYGRYGYGPATGAHKLQMDSTSVRFRSDETGGPVRLVNEHQARDIFPRVYERLCVQRPGMLERTSKWWQWWMFVPAPIDDIPDSTRRFAVHESGDRPDGYVAYRLTAPEPGSADGSVDIIELIATTPESHEALWRHVTQIDGHPNVEYSRLPIDDELRWRITDPRSARLCPTDALWLRILDVERALSGRGYLTPGRLTMHISDPLYQENTGIYVLEVGTGGATCSRSDEGDAEMAMDVDVLGSIYLGGRDIGALVRAGRIRCNPEVERKASRLFEWDRAPWCPDGF